MNIYTKLAQTDKSQSVVEKKKTLLVKKIINFLYFHGPKSAVEISKKLKSSIPTITSILNELNEAGMVSEQGQGNSSGGRRPNLYGLKNDSLYILGIDIGRYSTRMAIYNTNFEEVTELKTYTLALVDERIVLESIIVFAQKLIEESNISPYKIIGIGIGVPGLVDSERGRNYTYFEQKKGTLAELLSKKFEIPVFIENDAKTRALAEFRFGLAKGKKNVLVIMVDWGVGLGIIIDGKPYRGSSGFAGELSHIPMVENGRLCMCGKQGCLETIASGSALVRMATEGLANGQNSILSSLVDNQSKELELKMIIDAANMGDQFAISLISKLGIELGKGIATLIQLLNPELIILAGRVSKANQYLSTPVQQALNHYCIRQLKEQTEIAISDFGSNANILGAVALVIENIFEK
jgi:N-acetylglucosamine repressor